MRSIFLVVSFIFIFGCTRKSPSKDTSFSDKIDSIVATLPDFSGVILIADHGEPIYHKAFGFRNFHTREPLDTNSIFELASVSKQFTAMIIMMLHEQHKLQYDDALEKFIPGLPYPEITIRHLLNHTSGLPDYQAVMDKHWDKTKVAGNADNIEYLIRFHPPREFAPGDQYQYSNTGYMLLASVAEKASGKDFIALCRENIFDPLSMKDTDIRTRDQKLALKQMAWGALYVADRKHYVPADSFPEFNYTIWLGNRKGPGRISSTASDLLLWDQTLYTDKLLPQQSLKEAFQPARLNNDSISNYGFGWQILEHPALGKTVLHTGDNPGYKTIILRHIHAHKTVIVLCNNAHEKFDALVHDIEMNLKAE